MRKTSFVLSVVLLTFCVTGLLAEDAASGIVPLRRFALVTGSNNGGPNRTRLKYADSDAKSFAAVLKELGGVKDSDVVLLADPDAATFENAIKGMQAMLSSPKEADERREFVFYYSGHSTDEGLIFGTENYPYDQLRQEIMDMPADVRVAILDSCASGAVTRAKGGSWKPAFLFDASVDMKGYAFLTSSSAEESAQESDKIGASFFTHYLISGLRGAADTRGDGLVTLNDAYAFAFQETLASTEKTQYGPQHPTYDMNLTGSGELVLTDLRTANAGLNVAEDVSGRLYVRDAHGTLAVELNKAEGKRVELGLQPGTYSVVLDAEKARYRGTVKIAANTRTDLTSADLAAFTVEKTVSRGDGSDDSYGASDDSTDQPEKQGGFHISIFPDIFSGLSSPSGDNSFSLNVFVGAASEMNGFELGGLVNIESQRMNGFQAASLANVVLGESDGFQLAGLGNFVGHGARRGQMAGLFNLDTQSFSGFQVAGVGNLVVGDCNGFSGGGLFSFVQGAVSGFQAGGMMSVAAGGMSGVQLAGVSNFAFGRSIGPQIGGVFNWSTDFINGPQISGVFNYSRDIAGPQISLLNISDTVEGAQIGLVNVAGSVKGTQIGLINFARVVDGVAVGLLTFEVAGRQSLEAYWDSDSVWHVGFKLGSRYMYTLFTGSYTQDSSPIQWSYGLGFGGHIPLNPLFLDIDAVMQSVHTGLDTWYQTVPGTMLPRVRAELGWPLFGVTLTAGVSANLYVPWISSDADGSRTKYFRMEPQFTLGIEL